MSIEANIAGNLRTLLDVIPKEQERGDPLHVDGRAVQLVRAQYALNQTRDFAG